MGKSIDATREVVGRRKDGSLVEAELTVGDIASLRILEPAVAK